MPIQRRRDREQGQILVLFTLVVVAIFGITALVLDLGLLRNNRQTLVNALDAGALAGGTLLPVDGTQAGATNAILARVNKEIAASYPGLAPSSYQITFRCLIGVTNGGQPRMTDIPAVCDPHNALRHTPVASDFIGAGPTRSSICNPTLGDRCNLIQIRGSVTNQFTFGRAVGVGEGSTGVVESAACNGPCGQPPYSPLDVVVIIDRTGSMAGDEANLRSAAKTVLGSYDPNVQHIALGALGPSTLGSFCQGTPNGRVGIPLDILPDPQPQPPDYREQRSGDNGSSGGSSVRINRPSSGSNLTGQFLIAGIAVDNGQSVTVTPPSGWLPVRAATHNGSNVSVYSFYKYATGAEPSFYDFAFSSSRRAAGGIMRYTGVHTSNPFNGSSTNTGNGGNNDNLRANSVTTTVDYTSLVGFYASDSNTNIDGRDGMNDEFIARNPNSGGPSILGAQDTQSADGSTGNRDADSGSTSAQWAAQLIILRPAAVPPVVQEYGTDVNADINKWMLQGFTGTSPDADVNEAYSSGGAVVGGSRLARTIDCVTDPNNLSGTGTNLATPMRMATEWLRENGRPNVKWGIIFESDGTPNYNGESGDPQNYRCDEAIAAAQEAKNTRNADGDPIEIFTIAFDIVGERCPENGGKLATTAMAEMSSSILNGTTCNTAENKDGDHFFCQPAGGDLSVVFQAAAVQLADVRSHLVHVYPKPEVTNVSPVAGPPGGGTTVTITGSAFTGATGVKFGGTNAPSFTVLSDSTIRVTAPAGPSGQTVDVRVSTPGGTSPIVSGDRFRYN